MTVLFKPKLKTLFILLLLAGCLFSSFSGLSYGSEIPRNFSGGRGSVKDPYLISSGRELFELSRRIISDDADGERKYRHASYRQTADIDLAPVGEWLPIGGIFYYPTEKRLDRSFAGVYDGMGYAISNMSFRISEFQDNYLLQRRQALLGLFGVVSGDGVKNGIVKNIRLVNATLDVDSVPPQKFLGDAGLIAGVLRGGAIENCKVIEGKLKIALNHDSDAYPNRAEQWDVGGIVGEAVNGTVRNCSSSGKMEANAVKAEDGKGYGVFIGGIAGSFSGGLLENCVNSADVALKSGAGSAAGGIAATVRLEGKVNGCVNKGGVKYEGHDGFVGGISGVLSGKIRRSANTGAVILVSASRYGDIGGVAGRVVSVLERSAVEESFNSGGISVSVNYSHPQPQKEAVKTKNSRDSYYPQVPEPKLEIKIGGLAGHLSEGTIFNSYNWGNIKGEITVSGAPLPSNIFAGGIAGLLDTTNSRYRVELANLYNAGLIEIAASADINSWNGGIMGGLGASSEKSHAPRISQCYWLEGSGAPKAIGNYPEDMPPASIDKLSGEDFSKQESFKNWDFEETWAMGASFPELINQPAIN
jgi:hypothetical protein